MNARLFIGGLMLAASTTLFAQAPATPGSGPQGGPGKARPCAQEADPAKCEAQRKEMREKMREHMKDARAACKGKEGPDRGKCISQHVCAKAPDPAKCEAHAKERMEHRKQMHDKHEKGGAQPSPKT